MIVVLAVAVWAVCVLACWRLLRVMRLDVGEPHWLIVGTCALAPMFVPMLLVLWIISAPGDRR